MAHGRMMVAAALPLLLAACTGGDDGAQGWQAAVCEGVPACQPTQSMRLVMAPGAAGHHMTLRCPDEAPHWWHWQAISTQPTQVIQDPQVLAPEVAFHLLPGPGVNADSEPSLHLNLACSPAAPDGTRPIKTHQGSVASLSDGAPASSPQRYRSEARCEGAPGCVVQRAQYTQAAEAARLRALSLDCPDEYPHLIAWGAEYDGTVRLHRLEPSAGAPSTLEILVERRDPAAAELQLELSLACSREAGDSPRAGPRLLATNDRT